MTSALTFQNTHFDVIEKSNQVWLTAYQIGTALGYKSDDAVSRIYRRNIDEFTNGMTETVKLTVSGNLTKSIRVFSLRGAHLIAMFSRTVIAKQFRKWVLDVLDRETQVQPQTKHLVQTSNWPIHFCSDWNRALFPMFGQDAQYIKFTIEPVGQHFSASFCFANEYRRPFYVAKQLGDLGYFEASDIEELWRQVIRFCGRCHSRCAFL